MGKIFKKLFIGVFCLLAVVGLTGCNTEGLNSDQIDTLVTTLEKSQTFMSNVNDSLDDQINQDKEYVKELKRQNDLKEAELEAQANQDEKYATELKRQNDLKEAELIEQKRINLDIDTDEAYLLFKESYINFLTNHNGQNDNLNISVYQEYSYDADSLVIANGEFNQIGAKDSNGRPTLYIVVDINHTDQYNLTKQEKDAFVGLYDSNSNNIILLYDGEEGFTTKDSYYNSAVLGYYREIEEYINHGIDRVVVLDDESIRIEVVKSEDNNYQYGERLIRCYAVIDRYGRLVELKEDIVDISEGMVKTLSSSRVLLNYGVVNEDELMAEFESRLDGYEFQLPKLAAAYKNMKDRTDLTIKFENEDDVWSSLSEFCQDNPGSDEIFNNLFQRDYTINVVNEHTTKFAYSAQMENNHNETVDCDIEYIVTDGKLVEVSIIYDGEDPIPLLIGYPSTTNN